MFLKQIKKFSNIQTKSFPRKNILKKIQKLQNFSTLESKLLQRIENCMEVNNQQHKDILKDLAIMVADRHKMYMDDPLLYHWAYTPDIVNTEKVEIYKDVNWLLACRRLELDVYPYYQEIRLTLEEITNTFIQSNYTEFEIIVRGYADINKNMFLDFKKNGYINHVNITRYANQSTNCYILYNEQVKESLPKHNTNLLIAIQKLGMIYEIINTLIDKHMITYLLNQN